MQYRNLTLDRFQDEAIAHLMDGDSVLVAAPTGTGKTIIADWIVDRALQTGRQVVYTAPIKALSNQKFRDYTRLYGEENVGLVTGDLVIRRDAPCKVMTTEILRNMLLAGDSIPNLAAVILDEIHFLDDRERGTTWEEVLIYLPSTVQIVGLSATLSNLKELATWLTHVRDTQVAVIEEHKRAVPLHFYYASIDTGISAPNVYEDIWKRKRGRFTEEAPPRRGRNGRSSGRPRRGPSTQATRHVDIFKMIREKDLLPYLYFVFSRKDTEHHARELARYCSDSLLEPEEQARIDARLQRAAGELGPALDPEVRELYRRGIAFHHAGLHVQLKALVEELYEAKLVKVLYCTSTFAIGINMPARTVVFDGLKKYDGRTLSPLTTRQFMQKAGRAGRRGMDDAGHVIIRMDLEEYEELKPQLERYQKGAYEPVRSSFNLSWNSVVNLLAHHDEQRIREIVGKSFLNWVMQQESQRNLQRAAEIERTTKDPVVLKEARRLRKRAGKVDDKCWDEFDRKVSYLKDVGYLDEEGNFNAGARVLQHLQIAELPMTELVLSGMLDNLDSATLFGVLCSLTNELPRGASHNYVLRRDDKRLARDLEEILHSPIVTGAAEMTGSPWTFDPSLLPMGRAWAEGTSLQEILMMVSSTTDISGDLITGFRRAKDLVGQLREVYSDSPQQKEAMNTLIRAVSRDEVEVVD